MCMRNPLKPGVFCTFGYIQFRQGGWVLHSTGFMDDESVVLGESYLLPQTVSGILSNESDAQAALDEILQGLLAMGWKHVDL